LRVRYREVCSELCTWTAPGEADKTRSLNHRVRGHFPTLSAYSRNQSILTLRSWAFIATITVLRDMRTAPSAGLKTIPCL
jgi:hypothetical protein